MNTTVTQRANHSTVCKQTLACQVSMLQVYRLHARRRHRCSLVEYYCILIKQATFMYSMNNLVKINPSEPCISISNSAIENRVKFVSKMVSDLEKTNKLDF